MNGKIFNCSQLAPILEDKKRHGAVIVFTNGCFDLIHVGHISYLRQCKQHGDILVVGLNTDYSVQLNKGPLRPIVPLVERAEILAALEMVDYVVPFDEETPYTLITTLRPNILIKGADYTLDTIVGRNEVESWGGIVKTIELVQGKATRNIIQTIIERYCANDR
ncbi:MAG: D-glycero-beta-D-manno-heptose 1-phosphate adenylyltransferase [Candidatus Auribacterota bacterium]|jgi:D-beta-D-heptose 7-phosphate kinase/D-beta-D-heptose 1-phosphate adenosyltransferase|nr:D-glycero-beta-D-manno-heptose 1-phosphate adenylyltransferase [Candidatus Auribacterota bacterium]